MKTITYNLKEKDNLYFENIKKTADSVIKKSQAGLDKYISEYSNYLGLYNLEKIRTYEEYLFDMLSFGVYWEIYSGLAEGTPALPIILANKLYQVRQNNKNLKKFIDPVRGFLFTAILYENKIFEPAPFKLKSINNFINWLEATGEFREEVKRFRLFTKYLACLPEDVKQDWFEENKRVMRCFNKERLQNLAHYTEYVDDYLENELKKHRWKEDYIFCGRKETEYHLSMLGAELMNRAFNNDFVNSNSVTLLVPACMRIHDDDKCKAIKNGFDMKCTECNPGCNINKLEKKGIAEGFNVSIIPHSSDFTRWLKTWAAGNNKGVVGVACPLNLILGGLELKSLAIPAQCVSLNYCGCKNHWVKEGIATEFDIQELDKFLAARNKNIELKEASTTYSQSYGL
jgi:Uncharacterized conserved protein